MKTHDGPKAGDKVFLKVFPSKRIVRFAVKVKLRPHFIGSYEIIKRIGLVAYRFVLPSIFGNFHILFQVSQLRKYVFDSKLMIHQEEVILNSDLTYEEKSEAILDQKVQEIKNKSKTSVKVSWSYHGPKEATWELEDQIKEKYPELSSRYTNFEINFF